MAKLNDDLIYEILSVVEEIPEGRVATYGQIARLIGRERNSRLVGKVLSMAEYYGRYPCHRVVNSAGRCAPHWPQQPQLLRAEGGVDIRNEVDQMQPVCPLQEAERKLFHQVFQNGQQLAAGGDHSVLQRTQKLCAAAGKGNHKNHRILILDAQYMPALRWDKQNLSFIQLVDLGAFAYLDIALQAAADLPGILVHVDAAVQIGPKDLVRGHDLLHGDHMG